MGKELEYKLSVPKSCNTEALLNDAVLNALSADAFSERQMQTTYYDSPDRRFSGHFWTLRHRMEGVESIVCVKTPTKEAHTRGEWQISAKQLDYPAIEQLILSGAPKQLLYLYGAGDIFPVCSADFIRKAKMLTFPDGSKAEFAFDQGALHGEHETLYFTEVELELYGGTPEKMLELVAYLQKTYGLVLQTKSKFARARELK